MDSDILPTATTSVATGEDALNAVLRLRAEGAEEALRSLREGETHRALVLETANQVALDILARRTGVEALHHIADAARLLSGAHRATLGVARPDGKGLQEFVTVGPITAEEMADSRATLGSLLEMLLGRTEPLRIDGLTGHPAAIGFPPNHPPMKSFLGVPIRRGETIMGSLYLTDKKGAQPFTEADEVAVQALGAHAAVAIHNFQMLSRQRALVSGLIAAQEEERRAVAYDLHDGLTQFVMAAHAHLESFQGAQEAGQSDKARRNFDQGMGYLKEAVVESRRLVNGLRTLALDDLGLAGALEQLVTDEKTRAAWDDAAFIHNVAGRRFDKSLETAAYRVAQEALTNARKHSGTRRVRLVLRVGFDDSNRERLSLEVKDWGEGFLLEHQEVGHARVGLQSMIERIRLLDGEFKFVGTPGEGTTIRAVFPVLEATLVEQAACAGGDSL